MSRLTQILRGKKIKPLTEMESAVKYAIDNAGSGGGSSLPAVTSADNGDLLGVVEGAWGKVDPPAAELPAVSSTDNGSLLGVSDGAWAKVAAPTELPAVTGADNGDLLGVSSGAWAKVASTAPMVVTGTADGMSVTITTALADIKAAFDAGRTVYLSSMGMRFSLVFCEEEASAITIIFTTQNYDTDDNDFVSYAVVFDNSTTGTVAVK